MDLSLIKQKLAASQNKGKPREKTDYTKIFWKPKPGKHQIRILPSKFDKQNPFREIYFHYGFTKGPILALTNWGEKDPIVEFAKQLRKSSDKEDWGLAKKIEPKLRYFCPVLVRGEEDKGARLWEFGKLTYEQLLGIAADEDYGDYTDISEGRDFTVEAVEDMVANKKSIKCSIRPKVKSSNISEDAEIIKNLLENQPDILEVNKHYTFDELQEILKKYLNPEETEEESETPIASSHDEEEEEINDMPWEQPKTYKVDAPTKTSNADKFGSLFDEK
jgi:hypothetical protein